MKFARFVNVHFYTAYECILTVRCRIQDYEASIDVGLNIVFLEFYRIGVASKALCPFK